MTEADRAKGAWGRIEKWLSGRLPGALENLRGPADAAQLEAVETALGIRLPVAQRALLELHDGEERNWPPGAFSDGHWFLPCEQIVGFWQQLVAIAQEAEGREDAYDFWRAQVEDGIIFVKGPVKPNVGSPKWIPLSSMNGDVQRFVDFDPAPGGARGQIVEVDPECCTWEVIAPSFVAFLEEYADGLQRGDFRVEHDCVASPGEGRSDPTGWGVPEYLRDISFEEPGPASATRDPGPDALKPDEVVTIEGSMGTLMGGPEILFSVETTQGTEPTFLATSELTKGFRKIAVRQRARVRARPYTPETKSYFVDQGGMPAPDFVAIEYDMLRDPNG